MTTIAGLHINGRIAIAHDGTCSWVGSLGHRRALKSHIWGNGVFVAVAGDRRASNLVARLPMPHPTPEDIWQDIKAALVTDGFSFRAEDDQGAPLGGFSLLCGIGEELWEMDGSGGMGCMAEGDPAAIGSGAAEALGALDAIVRLRPEVVAEEAVALAVDIAKFRDPHSGGDTYVAGRAIGSTEVTGEWRDPGPGGRAFRPPRPRRPSDPTLFRAVPAKRSVETDLREDR